MVIFIVNSLGMNNEVREFRISPRFYNIRHGVTISRVASQVDMYYVSAEEIATITRFLQFQKTIAEPIFIK